MRNDQSRIGFNSGPSPVSPAPATRVFIAADVLIFGRRKNPDFMASVRRKGGGCRLYPRSEATEGHQRRNSTAPNGIEPSRGKL
jgi:hypothetical protein